MTNEASCNLLWVQHSQLSTGIYVIRIISLYLITVPDKTNPFPPNASYAIMRYGDDAIIRNL